MTNMIFTDRLGNNWERVTKKTAKRLYLQGETLTVCPRNLRPFSPWHCETWINKSTHEIDHNTTGEDYSAIFDNWVMYFEIYNCINAETGKYASFYKLVD